MTGILLVSAVVLWFLGFIAGGILATEAETWFGMGAWGLATFLWLVIPIGLVVNSAGQPDTRPLCLRGHEEYVTQTQYVMVGKVMVPQQHTRRVWVCDERAVD